MRRVNRRKFIIGLAAVGGASVLVVTVRHAAGKKLMLRLKDLLPNPGAAHETGRLYLRRYPEENDLDRLVDELLPHTFAGPFQMSPKTLHQQLHHEIQKDFEKGNVIELDGWMLSLTEARLYALVHLAIEEA